MKVTMFLCSSHRSDLSKSEVSIGEEIEEGSIEGPDISDKVISPRLVNLILLSIELSPWAYCHFKGVICCFFWCFVFII